MADATANLVVERFLRPTRTCVFRGQGRKAPGARDRESHLQRILALHQGKAESVCACARYRIFGIPAAGYVRGHLTDVAGKAKVPACPQPGGPPEIPRGFSNARERRTVSVCTFAPNLRITSNGGFASCQSCLQKRRQLRLTKERSTN
jgi:hypothetical protein